MKQKNQTRPALPDAVRTALECVIEYNWEEERSDYEYGPAGEGTGHVFEALALLRQWLGSELEPESVDDNAVTARGEGLQP